MPKITDGSAQGLVLQKDMLDSHEDLAAVLVASKDDGANSAVLNVLLKSMQDDIDGNESDSDAAHSAATVDRAAIRSEFAAADAAVSGVLSGAIVDERVRALAAEAAVASAKFDQAKAE